jgi:hypothetical protein
MSPEDLDNFFAPAVERLIRLRDEARRAARHLAHCTEEVAMLERDQHVNLSEPDRRGALIRRVGPQLDRARATRAHAEADVLRLQGELARAAAACPDILSERGIP